MANTSLWAQIKDQQAPPPAGVHAPVQMPDQSATPQVFASMPKPSVALAPQPPTPQQQLIDQDQARLQKVRWQQENPWGSPNNHPGKLGKIAHAFSTLGNIAGDIFAPAVMANIPGTQMHLAAEENGLTHRLNTEIGNESQNAYRSAETGKTTEETKEMPGKTASEEGLQGAETEHANAETYALKNPMDSSPELGTYRALVKLGMPPSEALQEIEKDKQMALAPKNMQARTLDVPGRGQVAGKVDSQGNLLLEDGTPAPSGSKLYQQPNYGQMVMPTKTATITNPATGLPTVMGWDEKTGRYDIPQGTSGSGAFGHQIQSAAAMTRMLYKNLYPLVDQMDKKGELGIVQGRFSDFLNRDVGNAPPDVAQLHQLMNGVISMMMGMYGFRRQQAVDQLSAQMGARMTPESMRAALKGIEEHADSVIGGAVQTPGTASDGQEPPRPSKVPADYIFNAKGSKGAGWYAPTAK